MPHTADLRIEAWAPTRDGCIRQVVLGAVTSFLDTSSARPNHTRVRRLTEDRDDDLLVVVLDEVIYLLDSAGEAQLSPGRKAPARGAMGNAGASDHVS